MNLRSVAVMASFVVLASGCATTLPKFGASKDAAEYQGMVSYYGNITQGSQPDESRGNRKLYFVYLWMPNSAPDLGVRVISPTKDLPKPDGMTINDPSYSGGDDGKTFFDPWIALERCTTITTPAEVDKTCASWSKMGENDDSNELPKQPSGRATNALMRASGLDRGLYRIAIGDAKKGDLAGTFLMQLGSSASLSGVALARTPEMLKQNAR